FATPSTPLIARGGTPRPVHTPPNDAFDEVTKRYVPWSMSSSLACAPSNITFRSSAPSVARNSDTSPTHGRSRSPQATIWSNSGFQSIDDDAVADAAGDARMQDV